MANADERLIIGLRKIHTGEWIYGKDTGQGHIFGSLSQDLGFPYAWGDPARTMPIPCEVCYSSVVSGEPNQRY